MSQGKVQFTGHASHTGRAKRHFWSQRNDWLKAKDRELRLLGRKLLPCCMRPGPYIILSRWPYVATSGQGSSCAVAALFIMVFHQWFLASSTAAPDQKIHEDPRVRHTTPHLHPHLTFPPSSSAEDMHTSGEIGGMQSARFDTHSLLREKGFSQWLPALSYYTHHTSPCHFACPWHAGACSL